MRASGGQGRGGIRASARYGSTGPSVSVSLEAHSREFRECVRAVPLSDHQVSESVNEPLLPPYRNLALMHGDAVGTQVFKKKAKSK